MVCSLSSGAWRHIHKSRFLHQPSQNVIHIRKTRLLPKHLHEHRSLGRLAFIFWRYTQPSLPNMPVLGVLPT